MQQSDIPAKFPIPFANGAGPGYVRSIPEASQIGVNPGFASLTDGFVPLNFTPESSGGIPPFGQDVNGLMLQITQWVRWQSAGAPIAWDATFSTAIGGYPAGARVASATTLGLFYLCLTDNNTTNPDAGGANWKPYYIGHGADNYYADTGAPDAYVITAQPPITAYAEGQTFLINPAHANTGAATLAVNGLAAKAIVNEDGTPLIGSEIAVGTIMQVIYTAGAFQWLNAPTTLTRPAADNSLKLANTAYADRAAALALAAVDTYAGAIFGLTMSNTPGLTTTSISTTVGACRDSTNTFAINAVAPFAKLLTSNWVTGSGNGGKLRSTALANGQTWFYFALVNPSNGAVEFGFDTSPTAPDMTLPTAAGYTKFRRIGAVVLEAASTAIRQFTQIGEWFMLKVRSTDYAATANGGSTAFYRPITVPVGIVVEFLGLLQSTGTVDSNPYIAGVYNPAFGSTLPLSGATQWGMIRRLTAYFYPGTWGNYGYALFTQFCDVAGKIYTGCNDATDFMALGVLGWRDQRGEFYPDP